MSEFLRSSMRHLDTEAQKAQDAHSKERVKREEERRAQLSPAEMEMEIRHKIQRQVFDLTTHTEPYLRVTSRILSEQEEIANKYHRGSLPELKGDIEKVRNIVQQISSRLEDLDGLFKSSAPE